MSHVASYAHRSDPPFEDEAAYRRRWSGTDPAAPVPPEHLAVFIADHLPLADRREGALALFTDDAALVPRLLAVVPDAPIDPTDDQCRRAVAGLAQRLCDEARTSDVSRLIGSGFGVVSHRDGPSSVTDVDRRWRRAADDIAGLFGMHVVDVVVRTRTGAIVTVPEA